MFLSTFFNGCKMLLQILVLVFLLGQVMTDPFQPVSSSCRYWDSLSLYSHYYPRTLHCILDEDDQPGIVNVTWKWVEPGYCPYFDRYSEEIHVKPCDAKLGKCPDQEIYSFQGIKYSACHRTRDRVGTHLNKKNNEQESTNVRTQNMRNNNENCDSSYGISIAISTATMLMVLGIYIYEKIQMRRRERWIKGEQQRYSSLHHSEDNCFNATCVPSEQPLETPCKSSQLKSKGRTKATDSNDTISTEKNGSVRKEDPSVLLNQGTNQTNNSNQPEMRETRQSKRLKQTQDFV